MGILEKLLGSAAAGPRPDRNRSSIQTEIEARLTALPAGRARFLAAFAGLLGRVADADLNMSPEEMQRIREILIEPGGLDAEEARLVADVVHEQIKALLGLENHIYTRVLRAEADRAKLLDVLRCLFMVAAADDDVSNLENEEIRSIAGGLGLSHEEFVQVRVEFADRLAVLKRLPKA